LILLASTAQTNYIIRAGNFLLLRDAALANGVAAFWEKFGYSVLVVKFLAAVITLDE
tara:strand:- start:66 stop:236 length:171 start_codon:yes stop_codon:yes gene_type:complete